MSTTLTCLYEVSNRTITVHDVSLKGEAESFLTRNGFRRTSEWTQTGTVLRASVKRARRARS